MILSNSSRRSGVGLPSRPTKPGHAGGVAHDGPGVVVDLHANEDVAREDLGLLGLALATVLDLGDLLGRDLDVHDLVLEAIGLDAVLEVCLDLVLVP